MMADMPQIQIQPAKSNQICPYCRDGLTEPVSACAACDVRYHRECLQELGRCATLGCSGTKQPARVAASASATDIEEAPPASPLGALPLVLPPRLPVGLFHLHRWKPHQVVEDHQ